MLHQQMSWLFLFGRVSIVCADSWPLTLTSPTYRSEGIKHDQGRPGVSFYSLYGPLLFGHYQKVDASHRQ